MDVSVLFRNYIENNPDYRTVYGVVKANCRGNIWLIGGALSRSLNQLLYGVTQNNFDYDFLVEEPADDIKLPDGWIMKKNKYGNPKFLGQNLTIDFVPIETVNSIRRRGLKPTIRNFLSGTPFTIQSIAYDMKTKKFIGEKGLKALKSKIFEVNDLEQAKVYAKKKGMDLNALIKKKADSMSFNPVFI